MKGLKSLGMVRNMDELGRVVIPKEMRRVNEWEAGQPFEMFADDQGGIYIKAYRPNEDKEEILDQLEVLKALSKNPAAIEIAENAITFIKGGKAL